jgi:hypothetical protein
MYYKSIGPSPATKLHDVRFVAVYFSSEYETSVLV